MPNLWRQFQDLLPDDPLLIGTVAIRHADGSATVTLFDGGQLHVLGDGAAGSRVFVPWYAVRSLTTEPLAGGYRMRVITDGPVQGGRDRLSALITRALRKKGMTFRFSPDEPDHDLLARSVEQMSAGRFRLGPLS